MKIVFKSILIGILVFISGFLVVAFFSSSKGDNPALSYYAAIAYSLLFLAGIISACTFLIIQTLKNTASRHS